MIFLIDSCEIKQKDGAVTSVHISAVSVGDAQEFADKIIEIAQNGGFAEVDMIGDASDPKIRIIKVSK